MSWREAPLYVAAADLVRWNLERQRTWSDRFLADRLAETSCALLEAIALALTFPAIRPHQLRLADQGVVRVREQLRLATDLALLSARQRRFALGRLAELGRMIGGWRRSISLRNRPSGEGPPAARIV